MGKPHFLQDLLELLRFTIPQHGQDLPIKQVYIRRKKAKEE
jgi:hypothetical protein